MALICGFESALRSSRLDARDVVDACAALVDPRWHAWERQANDLYDRDRLSYEE